MRRKPVRPAPPRPSLPAPKHAPKKSLSVDSTTPTKRISPPLARPSTHSSPRLKPIQKNNTRPLQGPLQGPLQAINAKLSKSNDDLLDTKNISSTPWFKLPKPANVLRNISQRLQQGSHSAPSTPIMKHHTKPISPTTHSTVHNRAGQTHHAKSKVTPQAPKVKFDKTQLNTSLPIKRRTPPLPSARPHIKKQISEVEAIYAPPHLFRPQRENAPGYNLPSYASSQRSKDDIDIIPYAVFNGLQGTLDDGDYISIQPINCPIYGNKHRDDQLYVNESVEAVNQLYTPLKTPSTYENPDMYTRILRKSASCDDIYSTPTRVATTKTTHNGDPAQHANYMAIMSHKKETMG